MIKVLFLIGVMYLGVALFLSDWLILASFLAFVLLMFLTKIILKIESFVGLKREFSRYWGEFFAAITGAIILSYLVFVKSESDIELAIFFGILIVPSAFLIGYLWLRGVNRLFLVIKIKILNIKNEKGR